ncbi:Pentatricopeptide repeat-containing protein [Cardamine amara subsp. amara]|uniref:Pentatricopeptide repeat-containing protein n=1 Tax=Cardamine amara subsp. amara TaxID=228776 RepID=A0ABD1BQC1_CARAN
MKHLLRPQFLNFSWNLPCRRSFVYSPKTIPSPELIHDTLKRRIERIQDSTVSITPLLREWCERGNQTKLIEVKRIISSLLRSNRYSQALQVSDWMSEQKTYNLTSTDLENRLLLISNVRGVEEAAKFLETIPVEKRDLYAYKALLNCCETHSSLSIAETTFQKMRDLGLADNKSYSTMLCIYHGAENQNHDMVVTLLREMDNKEMQLQGVPFAQLLTSFAIASVIDVQGMEKFLSKWGKMIKEEWTKCYFSGLVYIRAGSKEKGFDLLRITEQLVDDDRRETIYGCLMIAYCNEGKREDVYRLWNLAKHHNISFDSSTSSDMIKALTKITDLDEVLEECPNLDMVNFGLQNRNVKEEAEKAVNMLGKKESTLEALAHKLTYLVEDEDEERKKRVAEALEGRLHDRWNPKSSLALSAYACVQYVEGRRDMESAADILRLLNKQDQVLHVMDKDRLSLKIVEAMRGGGYIGGED